MAALSFVNARVFTGFGEHEAAPSFTVAGGRFLTVGEPPGPGDEVVDLGGATVLPGLLDLHTHTQLIGPTLDAVPCTIPSVRSIEEMVSALRASPACGAGEGVWIEGWGWDESKLAEGRTPTRDDLDRVSTTQPVYVLRSDCHSGACNSVALTLAGLDDTSPDPEHGQLGRFPDGRLNGVLLEHGANDLVLRIKDRRDRRTRAEQLSRCGEHFAARGLVVATDMMCSIGPEDDWELYREAERLGLRQQVLLYYTWTSLVAHGVPDLRPEQREGRIRVAGVKVFLDGSVSSRTAWMREPYPADGSFGLRTLDDADLLAALEWARRNGVQLAVHAMGDAAIEHTINLLGDERPWLEGCPSVRIEHATMLDAGLIARMNAATMTFGVATQIVFLFAEHEAYLANLSADQLGRAYALRTAYEHLPVLALSSDRPATTWDDPDDAFLSVQAAVTRRAYNGADIGAGESLTAAQALLLYTGRARLLADLPDAGVIAPGAEASFVILDRDVFSSTAEQIAQVRVRETWIAGERAWTR